MNMLSSLRHFNALFFSSMKDIMDLLQQTICLGRPQLTVRKRTLDTMHAVKDCYYTAEDAKEMVSRIWLASSVIIIHKAGDSLCFTV